jgi:hypothetical protein
VTPVAELLAYKLKGKIKIEIEVEKQPGGVKPDE